MKVLILGSGGREHALSWKLSESKKLSALYIAPGNAGTGQFGQNVALNINDFKEVGEFCLQTGIRMLVVGPEDPLVNGIADYFLDNADLSGIQVVGPVKAGAILEGSKDFAKQFMVRHEIPTAAYRSFRKGEFEEAAEFLKTLQPPFVLKADGLAAGKGVVILNTREEALDELSKMLIDRKFGNASDTVVIEEFLEGIELSCFALTDGRNYVILPEAKDYKRIGEGDTGLNTGGMGTLSPVPFADAEFLAKVESRVIRPTVDGLIKDGIDYRGFLFLGLMNVNGEPFVIEYNVRLGDPETESILPRIKSDLLNVFLCLKDQSLNTVQLDISPEYAATVMLVSGGYPGDYEKGKPVSGLDGISKSLIFHAGTKLSADGRVITNGGRVIALTSLASNLADAFRISYDSASRLQFDGVYYRKDLGKDVCPELL